jgi:hypothetical protein
MSNVTSDPAAFVLPVCASFAAVIAAFGAFTGRRAAVVAVAAKRPHAVELMPTNGWIGTGISRSTVGTSYDPQSRGSSG